MVWFAFFFPPPSDNEISSLSETVSHIRAREAIYCCRMHLRSIVSLSLSACQSEGIHKPVTASEDKLRQQAVRVPGTAGCVGCLPPLSPTHPPSVHPPLFPPPCVPLPYWCGFRCCSSPRQHLFAFPLDLLPQEQKGSWLPAVQHLPVQSGERRGGEWEPCIALCLSQQRARSVTLLEMPLNCCQIPLSAVQMEFNAPLR